VRWQSAISILTLILSIGTLVITATGTWNKRTGDTPPPSSPIVIEGEGREVGALGEFVDTGEVGVILFGGDSD